MGVYQLADEERHYRSHYRPRKLPLRYVRSSVNVDRKITRHRVGESKLLVRFRKGCSPPCNARERINTFNFVLRIECGRANNPVFVICFSVFLDDTFSSYTELSVYKYHIHPHPSKKRVLQSQDCFS